MDSDKDLGGDRGRDVNEGRGRSIGRDRECRDNWRERAGSAVGSFAPPSRNHEPIVKGSLSDGREKVRRTSGAWGESALSRHWLQGCVGWRGKGETASEISWPTAPHELDERPFSMAGRCRTRKASEMDGGRGWGRDPSIHPSREDRD